MQNSPHLTFPRQSSQASQHAHPMTGLPLAPKIPASALAPDSSSPITCNSCDYSALPINLPTLDVLSVQLPLLQRDLVALEKRVASVRNLIASHIPALAPSTTADSPSASSADRPRYTSPLILAYREGITDHQQAPVPTAQAESDMVDRAARISAAYKKSFSEFQHASPSLFYQSSSGADSPSSFLSSASSRSLLFDPPQGSALDVLQRHCTGLSARSAPLPPRPLQLHRARTTSSGGGGMGAAFALSFPHSAAAEGATASHLPVPLGKHYSDPPHLSSLAPGMPLHGASPLSLVASSPTAMPRGIGGGAATLPGVLPPPRSGSFSGIMSLLDADGGGTKPTSAGGTISSYDNPAKPFGSASIARLFSPTAAFPAHACTTDVGAAGAAVPPDPALPGSPLFEDLTCKRKTMEVDVEVDLFIDPSAAGASAASPTACRPRSASTAEGSPAGEDDDMEDLSTLQYLPVASAAAAADLTGIHPRVPFIGPGSAAGRVSARQLAIFASFRLQAEAGAAAMAVRSINRTSSLLTTSTAAASPGSFLGHLDLGVGLGGATQDAHPPPLGGLGASGGGGFAYGDDYSGGGSAGGRRIGGFHRVQPVGGGRGGMLLRTSTTADPALPFGVLSAARGVARSNSPVLGRELSGLADDGAAGADGLCHLGPHPNEQHQADLQSADESLDGECEAVGPDTIAAFTVTLSRLAHATGAAGAQAQLSNERFGLTSARKFGAGRRRSKKRRGRLGFGRSGSRGGGGRRCEACGTTTSPYWREPWPGARVCNACTLRYKKRRLACGKCKYVPFKADDTSQPCPAASKDPNTGALMRPVDRKISVCGGEFRDYGSTTVNVVEGLLSEQDDHEDEEQEAEDGALQGPPDEEEGSSSDEDDG